MKRARQRLSATALVAVVLWTGAACGEGDEGAVSPDQIQRDAKVIFRADLKPGSTGEAAARIVRQFAGMEGVRGTRAMMAITCGFPAPPTRRRSRSTRSNSR